MNWSGFDLNLVVVSEAVAHEKNLPRAGQRLEMSRPTVSDALAALPRLDATIAGALHDGDQKRRTDAERTSQGSLSSSNVIMTRCRGPWVGGATHCDMRLAVPSLPQR
jgi:hypothetical protein